MRRGQTAIALARSTRTVATSTRARGSITLMGLIEDYLAKRASHVAAIAVIDGELGRVYERLGHDIPAHVQAAETLNEPAPVRQASAAPAVVPLQVNAETVVARVLAAIRAGASRSCDIYNACESIPKERVKHALSSLVDQAVLMRTGKTTQTRYAETAPRQPSTLAPAAAPASTDGLGQPFDAPRPRTVQADGVEYETAWSPGRDAPSLIGPRASRASL